MEIIFGVPQGLKFGPLLYNIFLVGLFFIINDIDIASCADYNTPYIIADNIDDLVKASIALFQWFDNNLFKSNPDKCHLPINCNENVTAHVCEYEIENSKCMVIKITWR